MKSQNMLGLKDCSWHFYCRTDYSTRKVCCFLPNDRNV